MNVIDAMIHAVMRSMEDDVASRSLRKPATFRSGIRQEVWPLRLFRQWLGGLPEAADSRLSHHGLVPLQCLLDDFLVLRVGEFQYIAHF